MHQTLLVTLSLLLAVSLLVTLGERLTISTPIFLVLCGLAISLIPGIPSISIDPDLIFLFFLPPLLYEAAWFTSWNEFWRLRRIILVAAFGFVICTAFAVAYASTALIPGFTLALGFLLGGIVSPPDAVAATSVLRGIRISKSTISLLEGESLLNDAASLIVLRFALAAVLSGTFVWQEAATGFVVVTLLGTVVGLAVAGVFYVIHRWVAIPTRVSVLLTFMTPYFMYLAAEELDASGVMAVVSGGLLLSNQRHVMLNHTTRIQAQALWGTIVFALNGLVFILIGLELPVIVNGLGNYSKIEAIGYALAISVVIILVRIGLALFSASFTRVAGRFITVADRNPGWRGPLIVGWAGMRGVVSLASALSIPLTLRTGEPFPYRNLILFITFVVILVTLVVQGLTLPAVIRWVNPPNPDGRPSDDEQESLIRLKLSEVALNRLTETYAPDVIGNELVGNLKNRIESDSYLTAQRLNSLDCNAEQVIRYNQIVTDIMIVKRQALRRLQQQENFDDEVIRKAEARMDLEEEKIDQPNH